MYLFIIGHIMNFSEKEIQKCIWEHREDLFSMIEIPVFDLEPHKMPWEYEPCELLYCRTINEYENSYRSLERLDVFGCEVRLEKEGDRTIRTDFLGCLEGENGFVICELKVNKQPERQAYTELFAYANHIRTKFAPMGRRDIFYLLISPMEERIVREATINNLLYDKNRVLALIPIIENKAETLKFKLWIPSKEEFAVFAKTAFAFENIDVFKISWRGVAGKWSPIKEGQDPSFKMIHQLNNVSHYAAQLMEANGINGFVFCSQLYPKARDWGFLENGIAVCAINPFKSTKTRYLFENGCNIKDAVMADMEALEIKDIFPYLNDKCNEDVLYWMSESWSSCICEIALNVVRQVNENLDQIHYEMSYGDFTWDSYLNNSSEDDLCWNYDICLTGLFREIYEQKLEHYYREDYTDDEKKIIIDSGEPELHRIDMMYSQKHIREFIRKLIGYDD